METHRTALRPRFLPLTGGFIGALVIVLGCAAPRGIWHLSKGMAPHTESIPPPPTPGSVLTATALAFTLTAAAGAVLCLPRFHIRTRSMGAGMIAGWLVTTVLTAGALTGLRPDPYEPMRDSVAWANGTTSTDAATLAKRMDAVLVDALLEAPGPVSAVRLTERRPAMSSSKGDRLGAEGTIVTGQGKAEAHRRALTARLATRYPVLKPEAERESKLKVSDDILLQIASDPEEKTVYITLSSPHLTSPHLTSPHRQDHHDPA